MFFHFKHRWIIAALPVKKTPTKIAAPMIISIRPKFFIGKFKQVYFSLLYFCLR